MSALPGETGGTTEVKKEKTPKEIRREVLKNFPGLSYLATSGYVAKYDDFAMYASNPFILAILEEIINREAKLRADINNIANKLRNI